MKWDPTQYGRYADERNRPFYDLLAQVHPADPQSVVDVGCGGGELTATLASRWPDAQVLGIDSSPEMMAKTAVVPTVRNLRFSSGRAQDFDATDTDVLISNAVLQWVPEHRELLDRWAGQLRAGGWLALCVPDNFSSPSHTLMRELAESAAWRGRLGGLLRHDDVVDTPANYLAMLAGDGLQVNAWQTTYLHLLAGDDPVLEWVRGSGLRPVLAALDPAAATGFELEYAQLLRQAYPRTGHGTVFEFRRTFVVASKPS